jgi:hypothetical protein
LRNVSYGYDGHFSFLGNRQTKGPDTSSRP